MAHESDFSFLRLEVRGAEISGQWEIHLRDARIALGLDPELTGEPAWTELRGRADDLRAWLEARLDLATPEGPCPAELDEAWTLRPGGRETLELRITAHCAAEVERLTVAYRLLFDLDPQHRGYFNLTDSRATHVGVFRAEQQEITLEIARLDLWRQFTDYAWAGASHILDGLDHLAFLLALLLPAPLVFRESEWRPREPLRGVAVEIVKVVTAFTLAHSVTLSLSALGVVRPPGRLVEPLIALSVFLAAWNNVRPFLPGRAWAMAFGFGLIHGLGFAGALAGMGLPRQARGLALAGFNVGIEIGQLGVVALVLPLLFAARRWPGYVRWGLQLGSVGIAWLAVIWLLERLLGLELLGFV